MKRILISLVTIAVVSGVGFAATQAFFSDTETSEGNTITAGSIDISVDDENPWIDAQQATIDDMKPSYVRWTKHIVRNVGTNPLRLWKRITDISTDNNGWSEEECTSQGGTWTPPASAEENGGCDNPRTNRNNIAKFIDYDMYIGGEVIGEDPIPDEGNNWFGGHNDGGTVVISEDAGLSLRDVRNLYVYLGTLEPGADITVWQSYHMRDETGNWAQTDSLTYTIEFYGEQVNGDGPPLAVQGGNGPQALLLENKTTDWDPIFDDTWGVLKWAGDGDTFDYSATFEAQGLASSTAYTLIYYADGWAGNNPGAWLGAGTSEADGSLTIANDIDLGIDLPDAADANSPTGAKIWLVLTSDYNSGTASTGPMTAWNPGDYLFEYTFITYDDTSN